MVTTLFSAFCACSEHIFELEPKHYMLPNGQLAIDVSSEFPGTDMFILGDVFLRAVYTVFDADALRIGFANAKPVAVQNSVTADVVVVFAGLLILCLVGDCLWEWIGCGVHRTRRDYDEIVDKDDDDLLDF